MVVERQPVDHFVHRLALRGESLAVQPAYFQHAAPTRLCAGASGSGLHHHKCNRRRHARGHDNVDGVGVVIAARPVACLVAFDGAGLIAGRLLAPALPAPVTVPTLLRERSALAATSACRRAARSADSRSARALSSRMRCIVRCRLASSLAAAHAQASKVGASRHAAHKANAGLMAPETSRCPGN